MGFFDGFFGEQPNAERNGIIKQTSSGIVEMKPNSTGMVGLYVNGQLQQQSYDASYIKHQFDNR